MHAYCPNRRGLHGCWVRVRASPSLRPAGRTCYSDDQAGAGPLSVRWVGLGTPAIVGHDPKGEAAMAEHHLDRDRIHFVWNNELAPALTVQPGDTVHCWTQEVSYGQVTPGCDAGVLN